MLNSTSWARVAALATSLASIAAGLPAGSAFAQEAPSATLEQARSGEDGSSGSGANSGNTSTGNAERDKDGNGGSVSAGDAGEGGTTDTGTSEEAPLPENAETLEALGILDVVIAYDLTVLSGLEIPLTLLPPPPAELVTAAPTDVDTGEQPPSGVVSGDATISETSTTSAEPATGAAPTTGSSGTTAEDGIGATDGGEKVRERPRDDAAGSGYEAPGG